MKREMCNIESSYGQCHRAKGHATEHATGIGPKFWFAWPQNESGWTGCGSFSHGRFQPTASTVLRRLNTEATSRRNA